VRQHPCLRALHRRLPTTVRVAISAYVSSCQRRPPCRRSRRRPACANSRTALVMQQPELQAADAVRRSPPGRESRASRRALLPRVDVGDLPADGAARAVEPAQDRVLQRLDRFGADTGERARDLGRRDLSFATCVAAVSAPSPNAPWMISRAIGSVSPSWSRVARTAASWARRGRGLEQVAGAERFPDLGGDGALGVPVDREQVDRGGLSAGAGGRAQSPSSCPSPSSPSSSSTATSTSCCAAADRSSSATCSHFGPDVAAQPPIECHAPSDRLERPSSYVTIR
jgi:hypothetical protein